MRMLAIPYILISLTLLLTCCIRQERKQLPPAVSKQIATESEAITVVLADI